MDSLWDFTQVSYRVVGRESGRETASTPWLELAFERDDSYLHFDGSNFHRRSGSPEGYTKFSVQAGSITSIRARFANEFLLTLTQDRLLQIGYRGYGQSEGIEQYAAVYTPSDHFYSLLAAQLSDYIIIPDAWMGDIAGYLAEHDR